MCALRKVFSEKILSLEPIITNLVLCETDFLIVSVRGQPMNKGAKQERVTCSAPIVIARTSC